MRHLTEAMKQFSHQTTGPGRISVYIPAALQTYTQVGLEPIYEGSFTS